MNPLRSLNDYGQSVWLDFLSRRFIADGSLKRLIDEDGLAGATSNPSIFEKAIVNSHDYDLSLDAAIREGNLDERALFERVAVEDIRNAADVLRPVYEATRHRDGYVSIEVSPDRAMHTDGDRRGSASALAVRRPRQPDDQGAGDDAGSARRSGSSPARGSTSTSRCCSRRRSTKGSSRPTSVALKIWLRAAAIPARSPVWPVSLSVASIRLSTSSSRHGWIRQLTTRSASR